MIRIRKGGREFTATRMEIVRELARRGLLRAEDPVSVDDAPFVAAAQIPEIAECLQVRPEDPTISGDPWHHWSSTSLDSGEWETEAEGVLSSFLDVVTASSMPTLQALLEGREEAGAVPIEALGGESDPRQRHEDPDAFPPSLSAVAPVTAPTEEDLPSIPDEEEAPTVADAPWPGASLSDDEELAAPAEVQESAQQEGSGASDSAALPVSFTEWLDSRAEPDSAESLVVLGSRGDGLSPSATSSYRGPFSVWRVVLALLIGFAVVGSYRLYVRTGALSAFPTESQLQNRRALDAAETAAASLDGDGAAGADTSGKLSQASPPPPPVDPRVDRHKRVLRIRNQVKGNIVPFSSAEMLENSLFQEFLNLGAQPSSVKVEALRVKGSLDKDSRRPVLANLKIEFQGVAGQDDDQRMIRFEDRMLTAWLVLGKYATLGKVTLSEARISVREPTPWDESYEGRDLAGLWTGTIPAEELFPH